MRLFGKKTVASITSSLVSIMSKLEAHRETKLKELENIDEQIEKLNLDKADATKEVELAKHVHKNIRNILNPSV